MNAFTLWPHYTAALAVVGLAAIYIAGLCVYRWKFDPLAKFPGPKLASLTFLYEFYYDCIHRGQYIWKIRDMHEKYGPIVRISPSELHIATPEFYDVLYTRSEKREIWGISRAGFGVNVSTVVTVDHDLHRQRRSAMIPMFAKSRIHALQGVIRERVDEFIKRLDAFGHNHGEVINFKLAYAAFTADVAMQYFFGKHQHKIETPDFDPDFHNAIEAGFHKMAWNFHLPWLMTMATFLNHWIPPWISQRFIASKSSMASFMAAQRQVHIQTKQALEKPPSESKQDSIQNNLFDQILSSRLPAHEKDFPRLVQEGGLMVSAATVSTAWSLTSATYLLLSHPQALKKLKEELRGAISLSQSSAPTSYDLITLEHLPYLQAVIQESIRIGIGPSRRSPRISPDKTIVYTDPENGKIWPIPPRTPVTMSQPLLMRDPRTFPDPEAFRPERWIENPGLERYQVAFSKGSRACPGITLAMAELNVMLAAVFLRYGSVQVHDELDVGVLKLFETDRSDIDCVGDGGIAFVKKGSVGVRAEVVPMHQFMNKIDR